MIERFGEFVSRERLRFETRHNNMLSGALWQAGRYRRFLDLVVARYQEAAAHFLETHERFVATLETGASRRLSDAQTTLMNESEGWSYRLQQEIETFYLFAKIMLDRLAHAIEFYFGPLRGSALDSHDDLAKRFETYARAKDLEIPDGLAAAIAKLKVDVSDFRDYQIAHEKSPRTMRGLGWSSSISGGAVHMTLTQLYPGEKHQQYESRPPDVLLAELDSYLELIMRLIATNRDKTNLRLEGDAR